MPTMERTATMTLTHQAPASSVSAPAGPSFGVLAACSVASGLLLWASFFPLNVGWCAWLALVPLLVLVRSQGRRIYKAAFLGGYVFAFLSLKWMRVADPMMAWLAWPALAGYIALYFPAAIWLLRRLDRLRLPLALTLPVVWVSLEYLRSHFMTGFAWYFLGHSQHDFLPVIQVADLGGAYAVSFLVAAVNGLIFDLLSPRADLQMRLAFSAGGLNQKRLVIAVGATVLLLAGSLSYGVWRLSQDDFAQGPLVTLLQTNIPQSVRNNRTGDDANAEAAHIVMAKDARALTDDMRNEGRNPDLVIWPETTCPEDWLTVEPEASAADVPSWLPETLPQCRQFMASVAMYSRAPVLLGLNRRHYCRGLRCERYNSALLLGRGGHELGRYDKIHCVPFGEYTPWKETCPWMSVFSPYPTEYNLIAGERQTRFTLPTTHGEFHFGVLICFEDSDPVLGRRLARETADGPAVDFLVNISNDGWFDGTEEHESHLAICRFRAVEARRAVVRAVNMGISGVIDGNGRVVALPGSTWHDSKKVATIVTADVPVDNRVSVYARAGDWLPIACAFGGMGMFVAALGRRRNPGQRLDAPAA